MTPKKATFDLSTGEMLIDPQKRFKTQYNAKLFPTVGEINNMTSETIPAQSMSVREIMVRFAKGLPIDGARVVEYDGGEDLLDGVNWNTLDLSEKANFVENLKSELSALQKNYDENQKRLKQQAAIEKQKLKELKDSNDLMKTKQPDSKGDDGPQNEAGGTTAK